MAEAFAPDTRRQHVMAEAIKFEAEMLMAGDTHPLHCNTATLSKTYCEMLMAWDSRRSQPLPTPCAAPQALYRIQNTSKYMLQFG